MVSEVIVNCSFSDVTNLTLSLSDGTVDIPPASTIGPKDSTYFEITPSPGATFTISYTHEGKTYMAVGYPPFVPAERPPSLMYVDKYGNLHEIITY